MDDDNFNENGFSLIADFPEGGINQEQSEFSNIVMPVLPLRNMVLFPSTLLPVSVGRESSLKLVKKLAKSKETMAVVCQKDPSVDEPGFDDLHHIGTTAKILRVFDMPDHTTTVILQGIQKIS